MRPLVTMPIPHAGDLEDVERIVPEHVLRHQAELEGAAVVLNPVDET